MSGEGMRESRDRPIPHTPFYQEHTFLVLATLAVAGAGKENWKFFETVRNQFAGHPTQHEATKTRPGRILPAAMLGKSLRKTGLSAYHGSR